MGTWRQKQRGAATAGRARGLVAAPGPIPASPSTVETQAPPRGEPALPQEQRQEGTLLGWDRTSLCREQGRPVFKREAVTSRQRPTAHPTRGLKQAHPAPAPSGPPEPRPYAEEQGLQGPRSDTEGSGGRSPRPEMTLGDSAPGPQ